VVLIASRAGTLCALTVLAGRLAPTTSFSRGSVEGIMAVVNTQFSASDSPGVAIDDVAVNTLLSVSLDTVILAGNA